MRTAAADAPAEILDLDQRDLGHRAARRRRAAAALGAGRLAAGAAALGFRFRDLLRLGRDRPLEIFERELLRAGFFVLGRDDANVTAGLELAEQNLVGERLLDVLLDEAR